MLLGQRCTSYSLTSVWFLMRLKRSEGIFGYLEKQKETELPFASEETTFFIIIII